MTREDYIRRLLRRFKIKPSTHRLHALVAVAQTEGSPAAYNVFNTTKRMPGSHTLPGNTAGVQDYSSLDEGLTATQETLKEGGHNYEPILKALRDNAPAREVTDAWSASAWGTDPDLLGRVLDDVQNGFYDDYASKPIAT